MKRTGSHWVRVSLPVLYIFKDIVWQPKWFYHALVSNTPSATRSIELACKAHSTWDKILQAHLEEICGLRSAHCRVSGNVSVNISRLLCLSYQIVVLVVHIYYAVAKETVQVVVTCFTIERG